MANQEKNQFFMARTVCYFYISNYLDFRMSDRIFPNNQVNLKIKIELLYQSYSSVYKRLFKIRLKIRKKIWQHDKTP